jgi:hypothetical protein
MAFIFGWRTKAMVRGAERDPGEITAFSTPRSAQIAGSQGICRSQGFNGG